MGAQRLLIRNGFVVSMDPDVGDIPNGDLLVEDGTIVEIGRGLAASKQRRSTPRRMIMIPGSSTRTGTHGRRPSAACRAAARRVLRGDARQRRRTTTGPRTCSSPTTPALSRRWMAA